MPVIPKYDGPKVMPQYQPNYTQFQDTTKGMIKPEKPDSDAVAGLALRLQKQQSDAFLASGAADLERHIANTLYGTVDDKGEHQDGVFDLKGERACRPDSEGKSLVERTDESILSKANEIAEQMPEWVRQKFLDGYVRNRSGQVYNQVASHVMQQNAVWAKAGFDNHVNNMVNAVVLSVHDPVAFKENLKGLDDAVQLRGEGLGLPYEEIYRQKQDATSRAYLGSISALLQDSETGDMNALVTQATNLYNIAAENDYLNAEDKLKAQKLIDEYGFSNDKEQLRKEVTYETPRYVGFGGCALSVDQQHKYGISIYTSGILWQESGNQHFDDKGNVKIGAYANGKRPSNPAEWAYGKAQVTVGAARDAYKYLGWQWNSKEWEKVKNDPRLNEAVGQAYFLTLVDRYKGDMDKAVVAYNQGPKNVDDAVTEGRRNGKDWKEFITPTASNYLDRVKHFYAKHTKGTVYDAGGNPVSIFDVNYGKLGKQYMTRGECEDIVRQRHPKWNVNSPRFREAVDSMMQEVSLQQQGDLQEQKNAVTDVMNTLMQNSYDLSSITTDQKLKLTPDGWDQVFNFVHKATIHDNSGDYSLYMSYNKDSAKWKEVDEKMLPAILQAMPPQYRESSKLKYYEVHQEQIQATNDKAVLKRQADEGKYHKDYIVSTSTLMSDLKHLYGDKFKKENEWTRGICDLVQLALADEMQRAGDKPYTEDKRRDAIARYMDKEIVVPGRLWGENTVSLLDMKYKNLPARDDKDVRPVLTAVAKGMNNARGITNREPTEDEITNACRYLFMFKNPPRMANITVPMDGVIKQLVLNDAKSFGDGNMSEPDLIRAYLYARLEGITPEIAWERLHGKGIPFDVARDFIEDLTIGATPGIISAGEVRPESYE